MTKPSEAFKICCVKCKLDFTQNPQTAMDVPAVGWRHMWQVPEGF